MLNDWWLWLDRREWIKSIVKSSKNDGDWKVYFLNRNTFFSHTHIYADKKKKNTHYNNKSPYGG
jgi:hypothetical protein